MNQPRGDIYSMEDGKCCKSGLPPAPALGKPALNTLTCALVLLTLLFLVPQSVYLEAF